MAKTIREQIAALDEQIKKLTDKKAELTTKLGDEIDPSALVPNTVIDFEHGKGDTKGIKTGRIIGRQEADPNNKKSSVMLKVAVGEGFDAQLVVTYPANVKKVHAEAPVESQPAEQAEVQE